MKINDQVDLVLTAPMDEVLPVYRPNTRPHGQLIELPDVPYGKAAKFVVRTALVRVAGFDKAKEIEVTGSRTAATMCRHLVRYDQEHLVTIALNSGSKVLAIHEVGIGTRTGTMTSANDALKIPLLCSAPAVIIVHNHPSGDPKPSPEDRHMFHAYEKVLECQHVQLIDSIIVARDGYYSLVDDDRSLWPDWVKAELEV